MVAHNSFTSRRPNASHLPNFELPPPQGLASAQKYPGSYLGSTQSAVPAATLTSVGNLLTPPGNNSTDGISPVSSSATTGSSISNSNPITPFAPPPMAYQTANPAAAPYSFHPTPTTQYPPSDRPLFSPSLNSVVRGNSSPSTGGGLPPPPMEMPQYQPSVSMSAPSLPTLHNQQSMVSNGMMGGHTPVSAGVTQPSPVHAQEALSRPPPTPTYYGSQPSSTPQQSHFQYPTGPSPVQQSPISAGGPLTKMSPVGTQGHVPSLHQPLPPSYHSQRPYSYPHGGPVLSNVGNPNGGLALVGGLPHGMMGGGFNSGTAAMMHQYHTHPSHSSPQNDRPFRCDQCPQSFNRNHDLKRHKRIHLAVKPFPCGHCDKSFSRKDALKVRKLSILWQRNTHTDNSNRDTFWSKAAAKLTRRPKSRKSTVPSRRKARASTQAPSLSPHLPRLMPYGVT